MNHGTTLVTGGAGFIGSHLVDYLFLNDFCNEIFVVDNFSNGKRENLEKYDGSVRTLQSDLAHNEIKLPKGCEEIYHLAANPDVKAGSEDPSKHYSQNVFATYNLLEAVRKSGSVKLFVFASTSTVYGEPSEIPTPETYGPLKPISMYGASKLACESLVSAYASSYGFKAAIFRLANIIGSRSNHGIVFDFIQKLHSNQFELEILGDGTQTKSYLYVDDCISAMILGSSILESDVEIFNVGSEDQVGVLRIAEIVSNETGLGEVRYRLKESAPEGRGWVGDVKTMLLDVSKIKSLGWVPQQNSEQAVRTAARVLLRGRKEIAAAKPIERS